MVNHLHSPPDLVQVSKSNPRFSIFDFNIHDTAKKWIHLSLRCFKCNAKLDKTKFRQFTLDTTITDGLSDEDKESVKNERRKYSYYYCPCCLENLVIINGSGYHYESGEWVKIGDFEYNPSRRDDIQKRNLNKHKSLEEDPSRESGHI